MVTVFQHFDFNAFVIPEVFVFFTFQFGDNDGSLILIKDTAIEQRNQENDDCNYRHSRAGNDRDGCDAVALFLTDLFPNLFPGSPILLGLSHTLCRRSTAGSFLTSSFRIHRAITSGGPGHFSGSGLGRSSHCSGMLLGRSCSGCSCGSCSSGGGTDYFFCGSPRHPGCFQNFLSVDHPGSIIHHRLFGGTKNDFGILSEFFHILKHQGGRFVAVRNFQRHRLHDNMFKALWNIGIQGRRLGGAAVDVLNSNRHRRFAIVRRAAGHHLIHHNAQAIQVTAVVYPAALCLFRRDVMHTAQCFLGQGVGLAHNPGNTKVRHLHTAVFQNHHIVRLDIAVNNTAAMGMFQCLGDLHTKMEGFLPVQGSLLFHVMLQRNAIDQFHDDVICIIRRRNVINLNGVGMAQHGNRFTFMVKTAAEFLVAEMLVLQNLNGNQPI